MNLSACIEMIFTDREFVDRVDAVAEVGLPAFEFWGWGNKDLDAVKQRANARNLAIATFGVAAAGALVNPGNEENFAKGVEESSAVAQRMGTKTLLVTTGNERDDISRAAQHDAIVANLKAGAPVAEKAGITLVLEPLNVLVDHRGHYLSTSAEGFEIVKQVDHPNMKLLFDIYHQQVTEGNLIQNISQDIALIGHFHVADVPGRHQPGTGEINYANVFRRIEDLGYTGYVGLEFRPTGDPAEALKQVKAIAP